MAGRSAHRWMELPVLGERVYGTGPHGYRYRHAAVWFSQRDRGCQRDGGVEHDGHRDPVWLSAHAASVSLRRHFRGWNHLRHHLVCREWLHSLRNDGNDGLRSDARYVSRKHPRYWSRDRGYGLDHRTAEWRGDDRTDDPHRR